MNIKTASLFLALLVALLFVLSPVALAGQGCGTNWMGDTSGDTDFYVSKNQNQANTGVSSNAAATTSAAAVPLGSKAKVDQNATISSLKANKQSPQSPETVVVWTVEASNHGNEKMQYDFQLMGPSTGGKFKDMTGWIDDNTWTWSTTDADIGENEIVAYVARIGSSESEDSKSESYVISSTSTTESGSALSTGADDHPVSKTKDTDSDKPRVAPDEKKQTTTSVSGPNMKMPDPSPKPLTDTATQETVEKQTQATVESTEPEIMEAEGKWTIKLEDAGSTINPLTLIQTGDSVMGMGTYNEGNTKLQVSVRGSVTSNTMSLEAWTIVSEYGNKIDKHVELDLVKVDRVVSGSYELYSGEDLVGKGNATASKFSS